MSESQLGAQQKIQDTPDNENAEAMTIAGNNQEQDPLLGREHSISEHHEPQHEEGDPHTVSELREDVSGEEKSPVIYTLFLLLGGATLLGWNVFIVSLPYFLHSVLQDSSWSRSFPSTLSFVLTAANLIALVLAIRSQKHVSPEKRAVVSLAALIGLILALILLPLYPPQSVGKGWTYAFLLVGAAGVSAAGSYLQNASIALASVFGPISMAATLSGQGMIGVAVAIAQFASALHGSMSTAEPKQQATSSTSQRDPSSTESLRVAALLFFICAAVYAVFTLAAQLFVSRTLPRWKHLARSAEKLNHTAEQPSLRHAERKVRQLGIAVFLVFTVTIAVFPSITASIISVRSQDAGPTSFFAPNQFIAFGFIVFNLSDWIGRSLLSWKAFQVGTPQNLIWCSGARVLFIPLFLFCNVEGSSIAFIRSDLAYTLIMAAFGLTNGYLSTLCFVAGIQVPDLEANEVDLAGTCLALYLTLGLTAGALLSFPLSATV